MTTKTDVIIEEGDTLKLGDSAPNLAAQLIEESSGGSLSVSGTTTKTATDLTGGTVTLNVVDPDGTLVIDAASCSLEDATNGEVSYDYSSSDFSSTGTHEAEFVFDDGSGETITYPNTGNFVIQINEDLG